MFKRLLVAGILAPAFIAANTAMAATPESTDAIKIVQNNWTSQLVLSTVVGEAWPTPRSSLRRPLPVSCSPSAVGAMAARDPIRQFHLLIDAHATFVPPCEQVVSCILTGCFLEVS